MLIEGNPVTKSFFNRNNKITNVTENQSIKIELIREEILRNPKSLEKIIISNLENCDSFSANHSSRISQNISKFVPFLKKFNQEVNIQEIKIAALCHDIGKICIPSDILNKKKSLNFQEFRQIKMHPIFSRIILDDIPEINPNIVNACLHHHERLDGSGYPDGLKGEDIPYEARVLSVIDCFDALTSKRSYHKSLETKEALEIMSKKSGRYFDPEIFNAFTEFISPSQSLLGNDLIPRRLSL